jgi:hypothetical protein
MVPRLRNQSQINILGKQNFGIFAIIKDYFFLLGQANFSVFKISNEVKVEKSQRHF